MLTVYEIKLVLEQHSSLCMDNEPERNLLALALRTAMEEAEDPSLGEVLKANTNADGSIGPIPVGELAKARR